MREMRELLMTNGVNLQDESEWLDQAVGKLFPPIRLLPFFYCLFYTYDYCGKERRVTKERLYVAISGSYITCYAILLLLVWLAGIWEGRGL